LQIGLGLAACGLQFLGPPPSGEPRLDNLAVRGRAAAALLRRRIQHTGEKIAVFFELIQKLVAVVPPVVCRSLVALAGCPFTGWANAPSLLCRSACRRPCRP
jgi:hypothetical protein